MEGGVGNGELLGRGGGGLSQYAALFQVRKRNGDHSHQSKYDTAAEGNERRVPLKDRPSPPKPYGALYQEHCKEIMLGYGIILWMERGLQIY